MTIHKEGHLLLTVLLVLLLGINFLIYYFLPEQIFLSRLVMAASVIVYLLVLQFFRNPKISTIANPNQIIAPADGKVVVIEEADEEEYLKEKRRQISIFMSPLNVHVNRSPVAGTVKFSKYHPGKYLVAWHPKSSTENERTTVVVGMQNGVEILFRQIAGAVARRILCYVNNGDEVAQGQEFGFIKFGSRVDIFIPLDAKVLVTINQKTVGGKTVIAEFQN